MTPEWLERRQPRDATTRPCEHVTDAELGRKGWHFDKRRLRALRRRSCETRALRARGWRTSTSDRDRVRACWWSCCLACYEHRARQLAVEHHARVKRD